MKLIALCGMAGLALAAAGCASPQQQAAQKDDLLVAAGFQVESANSPQRLAALKQLPPNTFVTRVMNGTQVYLYADSLRCSCVYFGTQQNLDAYRQEVLAKRRADATQLSEMTGEESWAQ